MGMTIKEAHEILSNGLVNVPSEHKWCVAFSVALDTMRKYQKIKNIICKWEVGIYDDEGLCHTEVLELISDEVNGDENDN